MKKSGTSKKVLLMSLLSLVMCCAMLAGSTFAWFTDSVTSGTNRIVAGKLDVKLYYDDVLNSKWNNNWSVPTEVTPDVTLFKTIYENYDYTEGDIKWEPGVVVVENFYICNKGDLALEYDFNLNPQPTNYVKDGDEYKSLADVLKVAVVPGKYVSSKGSGMSDYMKSAVWENLSDFSFSGHLIPSEADNSLNPANLDPDRAFAILLYWEPSADDDLYNLTNGRKAVDAEGNEAGDSLSIDIGVNLTATQYNYEYDSRNNTYDKNRLDQLKNALALQKGEKATMNVNVAFPNAVTEQLAAYNAMTVKIESNNALTQPIVAHLGSDGYFTADKAYVDGKNITFDSIEIGSSSYTGYKFALDLPKGQTYTVTFTGAGYRQYSTTVTLTDTATVTVWNNAMSADTAVVTVGSEEVVKAKVTFLAGDIDNSGKIDSKDQTEVTNHFGAILDTTKADSRVKYDFNRDGKIDSSDTARINSSWGK